MINVNPKKVIALSDRRKSGHHLQCEDLKANERETRNDEMLKTGKKGKHKKEHLKQKEKVEGLDIQGNALKKRYILVDLNDDIQAYNFNGSVCMFSCTDEDFDETGWQFTDGYAFKEKLLMFNLPVNLNWRYFNDVQFKELTYFYKPVHPKDFTVKTINGVKEAFIINGTKKEKLLTWEEFSF
jgi:hypothetical protein